MSRNVEQNAQDIIAIAIRLHRVSTRVYKADKWNLESIKADINSLVLAIIDKADRILEAETTRAQQNGGTAT